MDFRYLARYQPQALALLRIVTGLLFLEHGLSKFFDIPVPFPVHPLPTLLAVAGAIELVGGFLITNRTVHAARRLHLLGRDGGRIFLRPFPQGLLAGREHGRGRDPFLLCVSLSGCSRPRRVERRPHADESASALSDLGALLEARLVPFATGEDLGQDFCSSHDLCV